MSSLDNVQIPAAVGLLKIHWFQLVNKLAELYDLLDRKHRSTAAFGFEVIDAEAVFVNGVELAYNCVLQEGWDFSELGYSYPTTRHRLGDMVDFTQDRYVEGNDRFFESRDHYSAFMTHLDDTITPLH